MSSRDIWRPTKTPLASGQIPKSCSVQTLTVDLLRRVIDNLCYFSFSTSISNHYTFTVVVLLSFSGRIMLRAHRCKKGKKFHSCLTHLMNFDSAAALERHERIFHDFQCDKCIKRFRREDLILKHRADVHGLHG